MGRIYRDGRVAMWNNDSLEYLVSHTWKINKPVNVIDFGYGLGFIGVMLLPVLPEGSSYTGISSNKSLTVEANELFSDLPYDVSFVDADIAGNRPGKRYDIVFCQMLGNNPDVGEILDDIKPCVTARGKIVCLEADNESANAAMYLDGLDHSELSGVQDLNKLSVRNTLNEAYAGLIFPLHMAEMGLKDIHVMGSSNLQTFKMNIDRDMYARDVEHFLGDPNLSDEINKNRAISLLIDSGLPPKEAELRYHCRTILDNYIWDKINSISKAKCLYISYGTVQGNSIP